MGLNRPLRDMTECVKFLPSHITVLLYKKKTTMILNMLHNVTDINVIPMPVTCITPT